MSAPTPILQFPNGEILSIAAIDGMDRQSKRIRFTVRGGGERWDTNYASTAAAQAAYEAYQALIVAYNMSPSLAPGAATDPYLQAIIPNQIHADQALQPGGVVLTAIGGNFPAGAVVVIGSLTMTNMVGDTQLWEIFSGASYSGSEGTYGVILKTGGGATLDTLTNGFTITNAATLTKSPNNDIWDLSQAAPTIAVPTDQTLPCLWHGSTDATNYDTLYAWNTSTTSWVAVISA